MMISFLSRLGLTSICVLPLLGQGQPVGGPYVPFATPTSATVMWITGYGLVRYGTDPAKLDGSAPALQAHRTMMTGLKPATAYYYDIPGVGSGSFVTPPAVGTDVPHTFVVYGDNRTRTDVYRKIAAAIAAAKPSYIVQTGDEVANGLSTEQWSVFFDISRDMLRNTVYVPALGNHEHNSPYWYEFFDKKTAYYSFDYGRAHWVVLNTDLRNIAANDDEREAYWEEQMTWADRDLEANKNADYLFLALHHPPYTVVKQRQEEAAQIAARLKPLLEKHKPQALFAGHDHNYQRHVKDGLQVVVTGGGGAPLYAVDSPLAAVTQAAESIENYVVASVEKGVIRFEARAIDGRVLDRFEIQAAKH